MVFGAAFAALLAIVAASPAEALAEEPVSASDRVDGATTTFLEDGEMSEGAAFEALERSPGAPAEADAQLAPAPVGPPLSESGPVLLDRVESPDGWATERLVEPSGEIVEHVVNRAGTVQVCRPVGSLFALRMVEQRPAPNGEYVEVVRDGSGALLRFAVGADGEPRAVALIAPPPR